MVRQLTISASSGRKGRCTRAAVRHRSASAAPHPAGGRGKRRTSRACWGGGAAGPTTSRAWRGVVRQDFTIPTIPMTVSCLTSLDDGYRSFGYGDESVVQDLDLLVPADRPDRPERLRQVHAAARHGPLDNRPRRCAARPHGAGRADRRRRGSTRRRARGPRPAALPAVVGHSVPGRRQGHHLRRARSGNPASRGRGRGVPVRWPASARLDRHGARPGDRHAAVGRADDVPGRHAPGRGPRPAHRPRPRRWAHRRRVFHDVNQAARYADHVVAMRADGSPRTVHRAT